MINGAHIIIYTKDGAVDRKFFRDVLKFPYVDVGDGWLIFGLPASEVGIHPDMENGKHEFYLMTPNVERFVADMEKKKVACTPVQNMGWGSLTMLTLPGGGRLGVYQAHHARPPVAGAKPAKKKAAPKKKAKPAKKSAKRAAQKKPAKKR
jgi:hypothetical protein